MHSSFLLEPSLMTESLWSEKLFRMEMEVEVLLRMIVKRLNSSSSKWEKIRITLKLRAENRKRTELKRGYGLGYWERKSQSILFWYPIRLFILFISVLRFSQTVSFSIFILRSSLNLWRILLRKIGYLFPGIWNQFA